MMLVCFDRSDVAHRPSQARAALCLTPSASSAAVAAGLDAKSTLDLFSDRDHARCVAAGRRTLREFDALSPTDIPDSVRVMARQSAWIIANIAERLLRTLPEGPVRVRDVAGVWHVAADRQAALTVLFSRIVATGLGHRLRGARPPLGRLYDFLAGVHPPIGDAAQQPWLITTSKLKLGFEKAFAESGMALGRLETTSGGWRDYQLLLRGYLRRSSHWAAAPVRQDDREFASVCRALDEMGPRFSHAGVRIGWRLYASYLHANVAAMLGLVRRAETLFSRTTVAASGYEANGWSGAALLDAMRRNGSDTIVINHNCHQLTGHAVGDEVVRTLYMQRKETASVTHIVHWTPGDAEFAKAAAPVNGAGPRGILCRLPYPVAPPGPIGRRRFKILHAANYQNWSDFFPWVAETSDEFVRGIRALSEAVAGLDNIDLTIRVRPKIEVDADVVQQAIVPADNITVCTADDEFLAQLAESDLLVSFFSTTVLQALQMRKPVLLWGSTRRFHQLPARTRPPASGDRAAVYAVDDPTGLRHMLIALRDHHLDRPLSERECAPFCFGPDVPTPAMMTADFGAHLRARMRS